MGGTGISSQKELFEKSRVATPSTTNTSESNEMSSHKNEAVDVAIVVEATETIDCPNQWIRYPEDLMERILAIEDTQ